MRSFDHAMHGAEPSTLHKQKNMRVSSELVSGSTARRTGWLPRILRICPTTDQRRGSRPEFVHSRFPGTLGLASCTCSRIACSSRMIHLPGPHASSSSSRSGRRAGIHGPSSLNRSARIGPMSIGPWLSTEYVLARTKFQNFVKYFFPFARIAKFDSMGSRRPAYRPLLRQQLSARGPYVVKYFVVRCSMTITTTREFMKSQSVIAVVRFATREVSAEFQLSTGRLVVMEGSELIDALHPPDSWMALASLNHGDGWGTRPSPADLPQFLERYVAARPRLGLSQTEIKSE